MADGQKHFYEFGHPDERFETVVSDNLHCAICSCVLKEPVMCKNEHCFCRGCITKHLENFQTCPSCNQDLTVESLAEVPRIVRNLLSEQKIRCDHHERGCQEMVQLGNLASHVAVCGKAPVVCANEECSSVINREDLVRHQSEGCRFGSVECQGCKETSSMMQEIGSSLGGLIKRVEKLNTSIDEMKTGLITVNSKFGEMENRFEKVENQLLKMKEVRFWDDEMESARCDQSIAADLSNDTKYKKSANECAYLVAGGKLGNTSERSNVSSEMFEKTTNSWIQLQPMKTHRVYASSAVYNDGVLVTGGTSNDISGGTLFVERVSDQDIILSSIEEYRPNANSLVPPCWSSFAVNVPRALTGHHTVVYNDRMLVVGGYDPEKKDYSDIIYEIQLRFPFIAKVLAKFPSPRSMGGCGVALMEDKIFMFGGGAKKPVRNQSSSEPTANVTMYDITKNEFKELAPLPYEVCDMATAKYGKNIILAGGLEPSPDGSRRSTVVSYNAETQMTTELPPMTESRSECCAVVDGNSLVVLGGENQKIFRKGKSLYCLRSVETFNFQTSKWSNLPAMKQERKGFIAEVV